MLYLYLEGMPVYNMYILGKAGHSLFYHEWDRKQKATLSRSEEDKLMSGLIHSLSKFCSKMSTEPDSGNFRGLKVSFNLIITRIIFIFRRLNFDYIIGSRQLE